MTKKRVITTRVVNLDKYREYADITKQLQHQEILINRPLLWQLVNQGLTLEIASQWLADDFDDYHDDRYTPAAFNLLVAYAQKKLKAQKRTGQ